MSSPDETPVQPEAAEPIDAQAPQEAVEEPVTFDADTVRRLRSEAAEHRVKARQAVSEANERLLAQIVRGDGRLVDPEVLPLDDNLIGEDGYVDPARVADAITATIEAKPYLASARPTTPMSQGVRQAAPTPLSFTDILRERM